MCCRTLLAVLGANRRISEEIAIFVQILYSYTFQSYVFSGSVKSCQFLCVIPPNEKDVFQSDVTNLSFSSIHEKAAFFKSHSSKRASHIYRLI